MSPDERLTRRRLLLGALALGASGCASIPQAVSRSVVRRVAAPVSPRLVGPPPFPKLPAVIPWPDPSRRPDPALTARAFETPSLRPGEIVSGLYSADTFTGQVALTFDDVPKPDFIEDALKLLAAANAPATFFVVGRLVRRYPELLKRIVDAGHELGNHTYTHRSFNTLSAREIADELDRTQDAVDRALGRHHPMRLVRPPYGLPYYGPDRPRAIERSSRAIADHKACVVLWTLGSGDTVPGCTTQRVVSGLTQRFQVGTGGVLVFHPTRCARRSLRPVLRLIRHRGLRFRTVRSLLEEKYGWPLDDLAEWGPKLLAVGPSTAGR